MTIAPQSKQPYPHKCQLVVSTAGWPSEQAERILRRLQRIKGWQTSMSSPDKLSLRYDAAQINESTLDQAVANVLLRENAGSAMYNAATTWRVEYLFARPPLQAVRHALTRRLRDCPRVIDAYFDHAYFMTVYVEIEDEPSPQILTQIGGIIAQHG